MGEWRCRHCGASEFGYVFWRIRSESGGHVADRSSLAACQHLRRKYSGGWMKGAKIYRVTRSHKDSACYWPPSGTNLAERIPVKEAKPDLSFEEADALIRFYTGDPFDDAAANRAISKVCKLRTLRDKG